MTPTIHFERPSFDEIVLAIRRIFPVESTPEFGLSPDSISRYFEFGGVSLLWQRIPGWESYDWGRSEISDEEFVELLFSPRKPSPNENVTAVTDECFYSKVYRGFSFRFCDLLPFAREVYPQIVSRPMAFFQPSDTIFVAETSRMIVILHHEGVKTQFVGNQEPKLK